MMRLRRNRLLIATFVVSGAALGGLFLSSLAGLFIARTLSKLDYGRMTYFSTWFPPMLLILGLGLSATTIRDVVEQRRADNHTELAQRFYTLLVLRLVTLTPLPAIGGAAWLMTGEKSYMLVALAAVCAVIGDFLLGILRGYDRPYATAIAQATQPITYVSLLLAGLAYSVEGVFLALGLSYAASLIVETLLLLYRTSPRLLHRPVFSKAYARQAIGSSAWIHQIGLCQTAFGSWVLIALGLLGEYKVVADLSVPLSLVALLSLVNAPILMTLVYPRIIRSNDEAARTFDLAYRLVVGSAVAVAAVMAIYSSTIIELLYSSRYVNAAPMLTMQAPLVLLLALDSLMTLQQIGIGQFRAALLIQLLRLMLLAIGSLIVLTLPISLDTSFWLSAVYVFSALVGVLLQIRRIKLRTDVSLRTGLLLLGAIISIAICAAIRAIGESHGVLWVDVLKAMLSGIVALACVLALFFGRGLRLGWPNKVKVNHSRADASIVGKETLQ